MTPRHWRISILASILFLALSYAIGTLDDTAWKAALFCIPINAIILCPISDLIYWVWKDYNDSRE